MTKDEILKRIGKYGCYGHEIPDDNQTQRHIEELINEGRIQCEEARSYEYYTNRSRLAGT